MPALRRLAPILLVAAATLSSSACQRRSPQLAAPAPKPDEAEQIRDLELRRSLGDGKLAEWATAAPDPKVRTRALLALARIQAPQSADAVVKALEDPDPSVREMAAFAAAELGTWYPIPDPSRDALVQKLLAVEAAEAHEPAKLAQLDALGTLAMSGALDRLVERLFGSPPAVAARAALALGMAGKRGVALPPRTLTALAPHVKKDADPGARWAATYAMAMSKQSGARAALLLCMQDPAAEVRLLCARGLGDIGAESDAVTLRRALDDPDYRVAVEAARALAKLAERCRGSACPAIGALADMGRRVEWLAAGEYARGGQPLLALAQQGLPPSGRAVFTTLRARMADAIAKAQGPVLGALVTLDCRLAAAMDRQSGEVKEALACGGGRIPEGWRLAIAIREIGGEIRDPDKRTRAILPHLDHPEARVKSAALDALGALKAAGAAPRIRPLIGSDDLPIAVGAAAAAAKLGDAEAIPAIRALAPKVLAAPEAAEPVADALAELKAKDAEPELREWLQHPHRHVRYAAARALTKLTGSPVEPPWVEAKEAPRLPHLPNGAKVVVRTEKGEFEVTLDPQTPLTSGNMHALAQRGYFRNLTFHRVVPDFVVQGGDPRGDGEGGPGYTLPCEVTPRTYRRGTVGMALSGPDTGGSQFFVALSPQPHLDGRYTAFGEVTGGESVIDQLFEGDRILEVRAGF